ncbi:MAG TPA: DinB family protein [Pyrinomonadaceae bacterium]
MKQVTLRPAAGFSEGIGFALSAMEEVREQLRAAVAGLSDEELARLAIPGAHSIGALVLHIGEAEWWWMNCVIKGRRLSLQDRRRPFWDVLKRPEAFASKNYSAGFCLDTIASIREETRAFLAPLTDGDLENVYSHTRGRTTIEPTLRWILHHLVDHEAQHKGQILMLKRLLGAKTEDFI